VAVVQHKKTGRRETRVVPRSGSKFLSGLDHSNPRDRRAAARAHAGPDYDVIHTTVSEALQRSALLFEGASFKFTRLPPVASDAQLERRISSALEAGKWQVAAALRRSLKMRQKMRKTTQSLPGLKVAGRQGTESETARMSAASEAARKTKQRDFPGKATQRTTAPRGLHRTQEIRPYGRRTQVMAAPPEGASGSDTAVMRTPEAVRMAQSPPEMPKCKTCKGKGYPTKDPCPSCRGSGLETKRPGAKTARLPIQRPEEQLDLERRPLLHELVTSGGVFASGLKAGDPILSHPRDRRLLKNPTKSGGAVTSKDAGHTTTNTGAWVPDKTRRGIQIPDCTKLPPGRDPITRQLAAMQPSNSGGIMTIVRPRTRLLGG
jgi:hypothetical protein